MISRNNSQEANVADLSPTSSEYPACGYKIDDSDSINPRFKCIFCSQIVRDPIQLTECGHRGCRECFDLRAAKAADGNIACPVKDCENQITNIAKVGAFSFSIICTVFSV